MAAPGERLHGFGGFLVSAAPVVGVLELLSDLLEIMTHDESEASDVDTSCVLDPFCRVAVYPGPEVPFDSCEVDDCTDGSDGQLYAAIVGLNPHPSNTGTGCDAWVWSAQVGAVRCMAKVGDDMQFPTVEEVQADAARQAVDADGIFRAIRCCAPKIQRLKDAAIVVTTWTPVIGGGCGGGFWTITGRFDVCC